MTIQTAKHQLDQVRDQSLTDDDLAQQAVELAEALLREAKVRQTPAEYQQGQKLAGMMRDPRGKALTLAMADQLFRSRRPARIANQLLYLLYSYGLPRYLDRWEYLALGLGALVGHYAPQLVVPFIKIRFRQETRSVILPAEARPLKKYLKTRRQSDTRLNLNQLGEAILGEGEARRRLEAYLTLLKRDDVEYISVKLSSICSQLNLIAYDHTVDLVKHRLRDLYRTAISHFYRFPDGRTVHKFVNLDMEEYRDLHLTVDAFQQLLDEPEFQSLRAGLVLQAYLPDSYLVQQQLTEWAIKRVEQGGAPIKIRLVKGANLAMEQVEASIHDWPQAPYPSKKEVDANFKRMVLYGCQPARAKAAHIGVASHNLFDVAYALLLRSMYQLEAYVDFEMLEGMANHQARVIQEVADGLLLYAPVVRKEDFHSAIAYLVRRLDENTAPDNFLHDLFDLQPGTSVWQQQKDRFLQACAIRDKVSNQPRRHQNRAVEVPAAQPNKPFHNAVDTDWSLPANQTWVKEAVNQWRDREIEPIPLQIGGQLIGDKFPGEGNDPSRPGVVAYRYALADDAQVEQALQVAVTAQSSWGEMPLARRRAILLQAAVEFAKERGQLIGCMTLDGGKAIPESDGEISEVIDFANYYARSLDLGETVADCHATPLGTVVVTPPWNFPLAIPAGGCLAALMAGNPVIFKPAPEAVLVGWQIAQILWRAGVPQEALQFVPCPDNKNGQTLVTDDRVAAVILTGARSTAQMFQSWKPALRLLAETSGKNSLIITGMADHDQAIKDLVRSAFGHAGQKCSAASLAICEAEVYDNPIFLRQLKDAAASLPIGSAWDMSSKVTPVIRPPGPELKRALTQLEPGESWLLEPRMVEDNPCLWSPGIKLGVQPGSFFHQTECFGPVLGLMRAENLAQAVKLANEVEFGLTGGIHSLDHREVTYWQEHIEVGNAYVNRHITGAIVQRQPFGGWKGSVIGPGAKAGGPNYVLQLAEWQQKKLPKLQAEWSPAVAALLERCLQMVNDPTMNRVFSQQRKFNEPQKVLQASAGSYAWAWQHHYNQVYDPTGLLGEANWFRYRPCRGILCRAEANLDPTALCQVALAARTCSAKLTVSLPPDVTGWSWLNQVDNFCVIQETEEVLINRLHQYHEYDRLRLISPISTALRQAVNQAGLGVVDAPVVANGRLALRYYLREQAMSHTYHRYGNIIPPGE